MKVINYYKINNTLGGFSMVDYKEIFGRMGNGWFILKLSEDNGINIGKKIN